MMRTVRRLVLALFFRRAALQMIALGLTSPPLWAGQFSRMIVFGSSTSDAGNYHSPATPPYYQNQWSNGPVWVQQLAPMLGVPVPIASSHGGPDATDYAYGGALNTGISPYGTPAIDIQVGTYLNRNAPKSSELFIIQASGNDFMLQPRQDDPAVPADALRNQIARLAEAGAKNLLITNMDALGYRPVYAPWPEPRAIVNNLAERFNEALNDGIASLGPALPGVNIILFDLHELMLDVYADKQHYGLENTTDPALINLGPPPSIVSQPDQYLYWDTVHLTESGHRIIAQRVAAAVTALSAQWYLTGGGAWSEANNWVAGSPNGVGAEANFLGRITSPSTIELDVAVTVGTLRFDNTRSYTLGGSESLRLEASGAAAQLIASSGVHRITVPLHFASDVIISGNGTVRANEVVNDGVATVRSFVTFGRLDGTGSLVVGAAGTPGTVLAQRVRQTGVSIEPGGTVRISAEGTPEKASVIESLQIAGGDTPTATLNLTSNDLVVRATPDTRQQVLASVNAWVASGRNTGENCIWTGMGITGANASDVAGLAVILNDRGGALAGQPVRTEFDGILVGINDILVKYTWNGDANLDGVVDAEDYFRVDSGFLAQSGGYASGDLDYNGTVDAADYFLIDSAFLAQSGPLSGAKIVPEPSSLAFLGAVAAMAALGRRRG